MPSLAHLIRASTSNGAPFDARAACAIAAQVCAQLERPHGSIAPSAILVDWDGSVALERPGHAPASALPYMAPERLAGAEPDARSDVHALAMVLLELVTGRPGPRAPGLTFAGDLPVELVELLERSSSPDPSRRHASPREMAAWLALAEDESGGAMSQPELAGWLAERFGRPTGPVSGPVSVAGGRRWRVGAAACLLARLGAGAAALARPLLEGGADGAAASRGGAGAPGPMAGSSSAGAMAGSPAAGPIRAGFAEGGEMAAGTDGMPSSSAATTAPSPSAAATAPSTSAAATAPSTGAAALATAPTSAEGVGPATGEASESESSRRARRKRSRAARRASAEPALAAPPDAAKPGAEPASCPISQAPSNTMGPARDAAGPATKDQMAPVADTMAPAGR